MTRLSLDKNLLQTTNKFVGEEGDYSNRLEFGGNEWTVGFEICWMFFIS
jgi:hypothetical protein